MSASTINAQLAAATINDPRWASVIARDPEADGTFYYVAVSMKSRMRSWV
jgi:AraC family transcriptional regulator of adaptative response/methylated-DNA-[protein]-cysteine methyltransferase